VVRDDDERRLQALDVRDSMDVDLEDAPDERLEQQLLGDEPNTGEDFGLVAPPIRLSH